MAKRNFLFDIPVLLLLLCLLMIDAVFAASSPKLSKDGCADHCGNITIPYPFGMGRSECFLDTWYEIDCRNGNTTPFLKKVDSEVLNISLPGYIRAYGPLGLIVDASYDKPSLLVDFPIIYSNYTECSTKEPPDLNGSPFFFSSAGNNVFTAVGRCNVIAMMTSSSVGCRINCSDGGYLGTCQSTAIPRNLQTVNVSFTDIYPNNATLINEAECNDYAFLKSQSSSSTDPDSVKKEGRVPVMLEWGISAIISGLDSDPNSYVVSQIDDDGMFQIHICRPGYEGNPHLSGGCQDINECEDPKNRCPKRCVNTQGSYDCVDPYKTLKLIMTGIGSSIGALLLVLLGWQLCKIIMKRNEKKHKEKYFKQNGGILLQQQLLSPQGNLQNGKLFEEKELQKATENFNESRVLGKGGQGTVYKGMLTDGRIVSIKKALDINKGNVEQFINEVMILSQINHRNIVKLLGCCLETKVPLLVYEFISNGNLYEYLHKSNNECLVSWEVRLQLATEIAGALFYLHSAASMPIFHRDIKSTNILLDEKYRAKIADFGTSRSVSLDQTHVTTKVQGTFGYLDPEFFQTLKFTDKSDVYSFGVVLVELLTGQKPIPTTRIEEGRNLAIHFVLSMQDGHLFDIVDTQVLNQATEEEILAVANLAKRCLHSSGKNRPTMKEVTMELEEIRKLRHLPNIKETEDDHMLDQCLDILRSTSARLNINTSDTTWSNV